MWSVFLQGKLLNAAEASAKQLAENKEMVALKQINGLKHGITYTSLQQLRYGRLLILADADVDGVHIHGLLLHFIYSFWPELIELGFACTLVTPLIKATQKRPGGSVREFFTERGFKEWWQPQYASTYTVKYFKGKTSFALYLWHGVPRARI
jgi:DNA topoisomerase-2